MITGNNRVNWDLTLPEGSLPIADLLDSSKKMGDILNLISDGPILEMSSLGIRGIEKTSFYSKESELYEK